MMQIFSMCSEIFIPLIKSDFPDLAKMYYISDGTEAQYKNTKNMANLVHQKKDYDLAAEWTMYSASHGKSSCGAISAVVKCHAKRASLKIGSTTLITISNEFFFHCKNHLTSPLLKSPKPKSNLYYTH